MPSRAMTLLSTWQSLAKPFVPPLPYQHLLQTACGPWPSSLLCSRVSFSELLSLFPDGMLLHLVRKWSYVTVALPYLYHQGKLPSAAPARPPNADIGRKQGLHSCSHALSANPPEPIPAEPVPLCCPVKVWGPLPSAAACEGPSQLLLSQPHPCHHYQGQLHSAAQTRCRACSLEG